MPEQLHGVIERNREHLLLGFQRPEVVAMLHVRAKAAEIRLDRCAVIRMETDLPRQR